MRQRGFNEAMVGGKVDRQHLLELRVASADLDRGAADPGVEHQRVEPPPAIDRGSHDALGRPGGIYRIPVGHGRAARIGDPAHHFIRRERTVRVPAIVDHNRVPLGRQRLRKGGPQAVSGPRHYCNSACHDDKARRVGSIMKA